MKTIELKVYEFSELSEDAKQTAYENWISEGHEHFWADENRKTLDAFTNIFPVKVNNFEYGGGGKFISSTFTGTEEQAELSGTRLMAHILHNYFYDIFKGKYYGKLVYAFPDGTPIQKSKEHPAGCRHVKRYSRVMFENSCVLTSYCVDDDILKPIYKFIEKPDNTTFVELLDDCLNSWLKSCDNDAEYQNSIEFFEDEAESNGWEFDEDGERI